jgi:hypothetical protein
MVQKVTVVVDLIDNLSRKMKRLNKNFDEGVGQWRNGLGQFAKEPAWNKIDKKLSNFNMRFRMHALSAMFFGMALQRFFLGFGRTGSEALIKVTEGATSQAQALIGLQSEWYFLQVSVGDAIGTFLEAHPEFMRIIEDVSNFIGENRELVGGLMVWGAIIGTLLMTFGMLDLAFGGMIKYFTDFYRFGKWAFGGITNAAIKFAGAVKTVALSAAGQIGLIILALALLYLAWENNFMGIKKMSMDILAPISEFLLTVAQILLTIYRGLQNIGYFLGLTSLADIASITDTINLLGEAKEALYDPAFRDYAMTQKPLTDLLTSAAGELGNTIGGILGGGQQNNVTIGDINVNVTEPVVTSGDTDFDELAEKVKEKIATEIASQVI